MTARPDVDVDSVVVGPVGTVFVFWLEGLVVEMEVVLAGVSGDDRAVRSSTVLVATGVVGSACSAVERLDVQPTRPMDVDASTRRIGSRYRYMRLRSSFDGMRFPRSTR